MTRRRPTADLMILRSMEERGVFAPDDFDAWLAKRGWSWQGVDRGDYGLTLEETLVLFVHEDPVHWCETMLVEPDTGGPWRFFEYQRESIRSWMQDVVHQDGAEVGKTREIVCLILWGECTAMGFTVKRPWMLVGAPQQTHLDEIILAVEEQVGAQESGEARGSMLSAFWRKPKRTPHTMHRFVTPPLDGEEPGMGRVYYRPAGHDGEAFRGVHVNALALMDEAAKLKRAVQWTEFHRALKPGCRSRVYSVPDGDRSTSYYAMTQSAVQNLEPGREGARLFHWPKTIMPPPFYTAEREREWVRAYLGRTTPGYKRNVLGEWGEAENPVWSWETLLPNVVDVPEYRRLKLVSDATRDELHVTLDAIEPVVDENGRPASDTAGNPVRQVVTRTERIETLSRFTKAGTDRERRRAMRELLSALLVPPAGVGVYFAGADLGETNDPTEIILSERRGTRMRDLLRVHARGIAYQVQRELMFGIAEIYGFQPHWGVDLGAAGTIVVRDLQTLDAYADARFDETLSGFQFSNAVDCIGEDGEPLLVDESADDEKVVRAPAKHWATQCITKRMQEIGYAMAGDPETLNAMVNHTSREGAKWPIYSKKDDHVPDARRMQMLRMLYDELGAVDVFSVGTYQRTRAA